MTVESLVVDPVPMLTFEDRAMGSPLRLTIPAGRDTKAAWHTVREEFEHAEQAMSRFRETSELSKLNRLVGPGRAIVVSDRLRIALIAAERARRVTDGRFDARVLDDLDRLGYRGADLGSDAASGGEVDRGGASVRRSNRSALIVEQRIDLGGIGKGLTLRWAAARLDRLGLATYLLEAGGDLVARGRPLDAESWIVGIEDPDGGSGLRATIAVGPERGAVATSSVRINQWTVGGRSVHHLLDPSTGEPGGDGLASVTVAGQDPAWAEVWSKTLFLAGAAAVGEDARARGLAAWWIDDAGRLGMTPTARVMTAWVAGES
jgi:FAD:protein FMN transferase